MKALKVAGGIVVNCAIFDAVPVGWTQAPVGVGIGWTDNDDGTFSNPYTEPEPTQEQLDRAAKLAGIEFDGVMCSATSEDMWGLSAVKDWVNSGQDVNFKFANGNTLILTSSNVVVFEAIWVPFRASFF